MPFQVLHRFNCETSWLYQKIQTCCKSIQLSFVAHIWNAGRLLDDYRRVTESAPDVVRRRITHA
jgi:hypothetical protein